MITGGLGPTEDDITREAVVRALHLQLELDERILDRIRARFERRGLAKEDVDELQAAFRLLSRSKLNTTQALEAIEAKGMKSEHVRALVEFIQTSERGVVK